MRLLFVVTEDWYFLLHRLPTALAAQAAGFEVHVATRVQNGGDAIREKGFILHPVPFVRGISWLGAIKTVLALRDLQRTLRPVITHHVSLQPIVLGSIAAIGSSTARVNAFTGLGQVFVSDDARTLRKVIGALVRFLLNRERTVVLVENPDDGASLARMGIDPDRTVLILGSGVDVDRLQPLPEPEGPPTIAFSGRLINIKGIRSLIIAHRMLRIRGSNVQLLIAGKPDPSNPTSIPSEEVMEWAQEPGITWLGHLDNIADLWKRASIAVLPSRGGEGVPMSILEAAACGRPSIATDIAGCREIVRDRETGLLVPLRDVPGLADAIETLATSPELRARYGAAARKLAVEQFSAESVGRQVVGVYRKLLAIEEPPLPAKRANPRVLFVVTEDWYFLSHRLPMARAAKAAGYDVHVATLVNAGGAAIEAEGFTLHPIPFARGQHHPAALVAPIRALRKAIRAIDPDICHFVSVEASVLGSLAAAGTQTAMVAALGGLGYIFTSTSTKARVLRPLVSLVLRRMVNRPHHLALVQNPDDREYAVSFGIAADRIRLIPGSGVETDTLLPMPEPPGPVKMAFVGRLIEVKGIRTLIDAHRLLRERGKAIELLIAGTPDPGGMDSIGEQEAAGWSREPGITWLGHVENIRTIWQQAHIAVLPSYREGMPKSLLEAAACGRPMVATDVPGCREIARDGVTGLLVPAGNAERLADAIDTLAASPELRAKYGAAARALVLEQFSATAIGEQTVALYRSLVRTAP